MNPTGIFAVLLVVAAGCQNARCPDRLEERQYFNTKEVENVEDHVTFLPDGSFQEKGCGVLCERDEGEVGCAILSVSRISMGTGGGGGATTNDPPNETEVPMTGPAVVEVDCGTRIGLGCE